MEQPGQGFQTIHQARPWATDQIIVKSIDPLVFYGSNCFPPGAGSDYFWSNPVGGVSQDDDRWIAKQQFLGTDGNILSFKTTRIGFFPMLGCKVSPRLSAGGEIGYEYVSSNSDENTSNFGGSVFSRYRVGRNLYAHAVYQSMNYEIFDRSGGSEREWVPALLLGGGVVKPLGGRSAAYAEVLFDVLQDEHSPYSDRTPVVNFGVSVGF